MKKKFPFMKQGLAQASQPPKLTPAAPPNRLKAPLGVSRIPVPWPPFFDTQKQVVTPPLDVFPPLKTQGLGKLTRGPIPFRKNVLLPSPWPCGSVVPLAHTECVPLQGRAPEMVCGSPPPPPPPREKIRTKKNVTPESGPGRVPPKFHLHTGETHGFFFGGAPQGTHLSPFSEKPPSKRETWVSHEEKCLNLKKRFFFLPPPREQVRHGPRRVPPRPPVGPPCPPPGGRVFFPPPVWSPNPTELFGWNENPCCRPFPRKTEKSFPRGFFPAEGSNLNKFPNFQRRLSLRR